MPQPMNSASNPVSKLILYTVTAAVVVAGLLAGLWLFAGELAPSGYWWSIGFGVLWFVIAWLVLRVGTSKLPGIRTIAQITLAATGVIVLAIFLWTSIRDVTVDEEIAVGVAQSQLAAETAGSSEPEPPAAKTAGSSAPEPPGAADAGASAEDAPAEGSSADGASATANPVPSGNIELYSGEFETQAHSSSGRAALVQLDDGSRVLTFENLDTDPGPDLRVYLVDGPAENDEIGEFVDLGALKGNVGNQQYKIPDDVDITRFTTVSIWCRAFSVGFAKADLAPS